MEEKSSGIEDENPVHFLTPDYFSICCWDEIHGLNFGVNGRSGKYIFFHASYRLRVPCREKNPGEIFLPGSFLTLLHSIFLLNFPIPGPGEIPHYRPSSRHWCPVPINHFKISSFLIKAFKYGHMRSLFSLSFARQYVKPLNNEIDPIFIWQSTTDFYTDCLWLLINMVIRHDLTSSLKIARTDIIDFSGDIYDKRKEYLHQGYEKYYFKLARQLKWTESF